MNLIGLHVLLTYQCTYECDHCFVWGSPWQTGVFTLQQLKNVFQQALDLGSIREFYFEGGESFVYYPVLVKAITLANDLGFDTGVVTNGYWATSVEDACAWLEPLARAGLEQIDISCDLFHGDSIQAEKVDMGLEAARLLGLKVGTISLDPPTNYRDPNTAAPGDPVTGGGVMFRGRAAEVLTKGLPRPPWDSFTACPYEDLENPSRIHLDPLGNLHLCQGLVMGNLFERPLTQIVAEYDPITHPVVGELITGGPARLIQQYQVAHEAGYVDACHLCYVARQALRPRFPAVLAPDQMYGVGIK